MCLSVIWWILRNKNHIASWNREAADVAEGDQTGALH